MFENFNVSSELIPSDPRFGCGPSLIPSKHVESLLKTNPHLLGTSHRRSPIKNLVKEVQVGLKKYFAINDDYQVVLGNGGATLLFDMIGLGLVEKKTTHYVCGEFSDKWYKSSELIPWIDATSIKSDLGFGVSGRTPYDADTDVVCVTLNETSTGVQLDELPIVNDKTLLAIDATSGAGQVYCDVNKTDVFFFSPQKVFGSEGGLFVAIMSPKAIERALKISEKKDRYVPGIMNWKTAIDNSSKNQTYNTPSVSTLWFLNEQIKEMNSVGYEKVVGHANEKACHLYEWANEKSYLSTYINIEKFRSTAVACIDVDERIAVDDLIKRLESLQIAYGIDAYRKLGRNQFRISMFHNINLVDLQKLTKILSLAIESVLGN